MLLNGDGGASELYLFLLPFFAALLGGSVYSNEKTSGRLQASVIRCGRNKVLNTSMVSGFLLGGTGGVFPFIVNIVLAVIHMPHMSFIEGYPHNVSVVPQQYFMIDSWSWFYPVYTYNQVLFVLSVCALIFVMSGLFTLIAIGSSYFTNIRFIEVLIPFVLTTLWWILPEVLRTNTIPDQWSHIIFMYVANGGSDPTVIKNSVIGMVLMITGSSLLSLIMLDMERRRDVE